MSITFKRIVENEPLGILLSSDTSENSFMMVRLSKKYKIKEDTKFLECQIKKRETDNRWAFVIKLKDEKYRGIFLKIVYDLVEEIKGETNVLVAERKLMQRYMSWENIFESIKTEKLSREQQIGLLGELFFLEKYCIPNYGTTDSILSWIGPLGGDKDFQFQTDFYEVKTTSLNKNMIHLNSQTQLLPIPDSSLYLSVVRYELASKISEHSVTLNSQVNRVMMLLSEEEKNEFLIKISNVGYINDPAYEDRSYLIKDIKRYHITEEFPQINPFMIHESIVDIEYNLYLPVLNNYIIEEE